MGGEENIGAAIGQDGAVRVAGTLFVGPIAFDVLGQARGWREFSIGATHSGLPDGPVVQFGGLIDYNRHVLREQEPVLDHLFRHHRDLR